MQIIIGGRGSGKTIELIKKANKNQQYILCRDMRRSKHIAETAKNMGLNIPYPISVSELPLIARTRTESVLVDDMEDVLETLIGTKIDYGTTSCETKEL